MTTETWANAPTAARPRVRIRPLRFPEVPANAVAQFAGGGAVLGGVYMQWGVAALLMVAGAALVVLGMLREAGKV